MRFHWLTEWCFQVHNFNITMNYFQHLVSRTEKIIFSKYVRQSRFIRIVLCEIEGYLYNNYDFYCADRSFCCRHSSHDNWFIRPSRYDVDWYRRWKNVSFTWLTHDIHCSRAIICWLSAWTIIKYLSLPKQYGSNEAACAWSEKSHRKRRAEG